MMMQVNQIMSILVKKIQIEKIQIIKKVKTIEIHLHLMK